jgi:hypothetical protein
MLAAIIAIAIGVPATRSPTKVTRSSVDLKSLA